MSVICPGLPGGPVFKEKLHDMAFGVGDTVVLRTVVVVPPACTVVWHKNEELLSTGNRLKVCWDYLLDYNPHYLLYIFFLFKRLIYRLKTIFAKHSCTH